MGELQLVRAGPGLVQITDQHGVGAADLGLSIHACSHATGISLDARAVRPKQLDHRREGRASGKLGNLKGDPITFVCREGPQVQIPLINRSQVIYSIGQRSAFVPGRHSETAGHLGQSQRVGASASLGGVADHYGVNTIEIGLNVQARGHAVRFDPQGGAAGREHFEPWRKARTAGKLGNLHREMVTMVRRNGP